MKKRYEAVVIGASAGGLTAFSAILPELPSDFCPVIIVQHMKEDAESYLPSYLQRITSMPVKEADLNEPIHSGMVYIAPANYHLLVEFDRTFSLSTEERVHFVRPSIDVLFESAAMVYRERLIGVILTGANDDGSDGLKVVKHYGGLTIVQDPSTAESPYMPESAIKAVAVDHVLPLSEMGEFLRAVYAVGV